MALSKVNACLVMMFYLVITGPPHAEAAITCAGILSNLSPCLDYLRRGGPVPPSCCDGLRALNNAAPTTPDVQEACRCAKILVPRIGVNPTLLNRGPAICHVNIPYKYSPSLDCSTITR